MFFILLKPELSWIYGFAGLLAIITLLYPFLLSVYVFMNRHRKDMVDVYEDLLQDNDMFQPITYVYFTFNYYRKIFFALCLTNTIPGLVQIYLLVTLNVVHLSFTVYLVVHEVYRSKAKVVLKIVNTSCMIILEVLIGVYNVNNYSNEVNVDIGVACFYIASIATVFGIIDAIIKIIDVIQQEVGKKKVGPDQNKAKKKEVRKEFRGEIRCHLGEEIEKRPKDPKEIKFKHDKELMGNTF